MKSINQFILKNIKSFELLGVLMRIVIFSIVSWMGDNSPLLFVWIFSAIDAFILSWCALLKKDTAYTLLNIFWIVVSLVGIIRVLGLI